MPDENKVSNKDEFGHSRGVLARTSGGLIGVNFGTPNYWECDLELMNVFLRIINEHKVRLNEQVWTIDDLIEHTSSALEIGHCDKK